MSPTILNLRHYNTPTLEGIVQPSSNTGYQMDRLPYLEYHHRDGYRLGNPPEPAPGHRGRSHHNRRGHVRRSQGLVPVISGIASQVGGFKINHLEAPIPIWGTI